MIKNKQKKLDDLDERIKAARSKEEKSSDVNDNETEQSPEAKKSAHAGSEFLASVVSGALLGYGIDWYFKTTPWAMIFFIIIGFVGGVYRANGAMKKKSEENTK